MPAALVSSGSQGLPNILGCPAFLHEGMTVLNVGQACCPRRILAQNDVLAGSRAWLCACRDQHDRAAYLSSLEARERDVSDGE